LNVAPINLAWGSSVVVSIQAQNAFGVSAIAIGSGATLIYYPSPPVSFN